MHLDRLLGGVAGFGFMGFVYLPKRGLISGPLPMTGFSFANSVPARLMLKMIVPSPKNYAAFSPDYLGSDFKSRRNQAIYRI